MPILNIFDEEASTFVLRLSSNYCYRCPLIDYYYLLAVLLSPALKTPQNKVQPPRWLEILTIELEMCVNIGRARDPTLRAWVKFLGPVVKTMMLVLAG